MVEFISTLFPWRYPGMMDFPDAMVRAGPRSIELRRQEIFGPFEGSEDHVPPGGNKAAPVTARKRRPMRMMLPINICCNNCGNPTNKGTKIESSKEDVPGEIFSGIQIFRFRFSCGMCAAELVMKSDPQNSDFVMEAGAFRIIEPRPAADEAPESQTLDSNEEMDAMAVKLARI